MVGITGIICMSARGMTHILQIFGTKPPLVPVIVLRLTVSTPDTVGRRTMRTLSRFLILGIIGGSAWAAVRTVSAEPPQTLPPALPAIPSGSTYHGTPIATAGITGNISCASASCHGADVAHSRAGGESHTFADADPHRRAYSVLFNDRSRRMVELLKTPTPAHQTALCLKCHGAAPPNRDQELTPLAAAHREGANCENCHGAAEKWLTVHYTAPWKAMSAEEKAGFGFLPTKDLAYRSTLCASCHVGDATREVDHQLIAAGHPALRFELSAYQLEPIYTKHWTEKAYGPDVEAWTWMIGQLGTARAGAELVRHRAAEAAQPTVHKRDWPEFAEYTCFSCHQDISGFSLASPDRPGLRPSSPRPGTLPWGSWLYPIPLDLARTPSTMWTGPAAAPNSLLALAETFRSTDRPSPAKVRDLSQATVVELDRWLTDVQSLASRRSRLEPLTATELRQALKQAARFAGSVPETGAKSTDWDRTVQGFLAVAALYRSLCAVEPPARSPEVEVHLKAITNLLRFPQKQDSPVSSDAERVRALAEHWAAVQKWVNGLDSTASR